jgi:hypothetical protein
MKRAGIALLGALVACGGKQVAMVAGNCIQELLPTPPLAGEWSCTQSGSAGARTLTECPSLIAAGVACPLRAGPDNSVELGFRECFACDGTTGTDWTCDTTEWQSAGTYSCQPLNPRDSGPSSSDADADR